MTTESKSGYRELSHTADWALQVWAPSFESLLIQAAEGMYDLAGIQLAEDQAIERRVEVDGLDQEDLLVSFLSELLYLWSTEGLAFERFEINMHEARLVANLEGAEVTAQHKEIKAVTYHGLRIEDLDDRLQATVTFDV